MSEFVDTNVLLYAAANDAVRKQQLSLGLIARLWNERKGVLSTQVLSEFYHNATRKLRLSAESAEEAVKDYSRWKLHRPDHASVLGAIRLEQRYRVAWYEAMILNSALETECSILWTEDFQDGQRFGDLTVRNPYKSVRSV
ncbi:MAG TPA: PIN domain-containing protein [Bryobacteraceae bacterium]|nr:PIN domain-containing protein [Bryobacteraceae bacterium]HWC00777.1 PIN domain-containing protein [Bryobacteraceae bacterium]